MHVSNAACRTVNMLQLLTRAERLFIRGACSPPAEANGLTTLVGRTPESLIMSVCKWQLRTKFPGINLESSTCLVVGVSAVISK
jgi:hypothetical protein